MDVCQAILAEAGAGTAEHSDDVVLIAEAIGERLGVTGSDAENLLIAAQLHDIGKAWVPSRILEKRGPLSDEEWALMRRHTIVGEEILGAVEELAAVGLLVRHSHERWDGAGYPDGIKGAEIPVGSRIIFCADAFHAIRCDRPYRAGRSAAEALAEIKRCSGTQFDPTVVAALDDVVRERRSGPRGPHSSRLLALLMCLVVGGAGTAVARSGLLGDAGAPASSSPASTAPAFCGATGCETSGGSSAGTNSVDPRTAARGRAQHRRNHGRVTRHPDARASTGDQAGSEPLAKRGGSTGNAGKHSGKSTSAPGHTKPTSSSGPGESGSAPGHTKPASSSGPGESGSAPGHTKPTSSGSDPSSSSNGGDESNGNSAKANGSDKK